MRFFILHTKLVFVFFPVGFNGTINAFSTPLSNSYKCGTYKNFSFDGTNNGKVDLFLRNFQIQAFKNSTANFDSGMFIFYLSAFSFYGSENVKILVFVIPNFKLT